MAIWWFALVLLLLNDQVLKTARVLPGWLTGKLSDFAGLIVATVLLTMLTRVRRGPGRVVCFALVAAGFSAVKLSPPAARAMETALGWLGIRWHLWSDPTDLIALSVLPAAWRVDTARAFHRSRSVGTARSKLAKIRDTLGVVLGAAACLATSKEIPEICRTAAFLANVTQEDITVQIFRARAPLDCAGIAADPATVLTAAPFDPEACWRLGSGALVPLARNWLRLREGNVIGGPGGPAPACDAIIVRVEGQQDALLSWQAIGDDDVDVSSIDLLLDYQIGPHGMYLERLRDRIYLAASPLITSQPVSITLPDITTCSIVQQGILDGGTP